MSTRELTAKPTERTQSLTTWLKVLLFVLIWCTYIASYTNSFGIVSEAKYKTFQFDSEELVVSRLIADGDSQSNLGKANLGRLIPQSAQDYSYHMRVSRSTPYLDGGWEPTPPTPKDRMTYVPYLSNFGLQGDLYSALHRLTGLGVTNMRLLNVILLAFALSALCILYSGLLGKTFGWCWYITTIASPWLISFAPNMYWMAFLWFLPQLICAASLLNLNSRFIQISGAPILTFCFAIKCLTGYEYISAIILNAAIVFLIAAWRDGKKFNPQRMFKYAFVTCLCGAAGFAIAMYFHAGLRGDSLWEGLQNIFQEDVLRRTWGDGANFADLEDAGGIQASLQANPLTIWRRYHLHWGNDKAITLLSLACVAALVVSLPIDRNFFLSKLTFLVLFAVPSSSWYILAKGHSFIHFHLNYVLQYCGLAAAMMFVCVQTATLCWQYFQARFGRPRLSS